MSEASVEIDADALTLTWTADFGASAERLWQLWANPRFLERWMGPPTYPAKVTTHELIPGGDVIYHMTSPEGEKYPGSWRITSINPPTGLDYKDGGEDADGGMPNTSWSMRLNEHLGETQMVLRCSFASREEMDHLIAMGTEEGHTLTIGQMDTLLSEIPE